MENIGLRLKQIRKLLGKSQEEIANELGLTKQAISNIEHSKSSPNIPLLHKLLVDYGVNINFIISGNGNIFTKDEKASESLKNTILKEVEDLLSARGIE